MKGIFFEVDKFACLLMAIGGLITYFLWRWSYQFATPFLFFSDLSTFLSNKGKALWTKWPKTCLYCGLGSFALAFIDPHLLLDRNIWGPPPPANSTNREPPTEGIAIYLILDQSGSMKEEVPVQLPSGAIQMESKIDLLKQVTKEFIVGDPSLGLDGRPNDLIGLIFFARAARVMVPLTLDHDAVLEQLAKFQPIQDPTQDGTSIGYAIFKTANLIAATRHYAEELIKKGEPAYTIKNSIMILITDGLQSPSPLDQGKRLRNMDIPEAAAYAKEKGIHLYIVNIEPGLSTEEFAPFRHIMEKAAQSTGGKFYLVSGGTNLEDIYRDIDSLEKSKIPAPPGVVIEKDKRPDLYRRLSFYPYLIAFGLLCLFLGIGLDTTLLRRVP